jgi:Rps23 Pro-64 3,4-dihydroxylase Tpa1-like proline 4-hydroxylase
MNKLINIEHFMKICEIHSLDYSKNEPFPHFLIDNFLSNTDALEISEETKKDKIKWGKRFHGNSKKLFCSDIKFFGPVTSEFFKETNSKDFIKCIEILSGISDIIEDNNLEGGGIHLIENGGYLNIHADFNYHGRLKAYRRLNLLFYLNEDWKTEYEGALELWDKDMKVCVKKYYPIFNRLIIFSTTDNSFHGHPERLKTPNNVFRKSLANYYYTKSMPNSSKPHGTLYKTKNHL